MNNQKLHTKIQEVLNQIGNPKYEMVDENQIIIHKNMDLKYYPLRDEFRYKGMPFMKVENLVERIKLHLSKNCIFEKRYCRFAKNENGSFECIAKSDDEMTCKE